MAEMTMRQALEMAAKLGHVPLRIDGPPINMTGGGPSNPLDEVTGIWGVPDRNNPGKVIMLGYPGDGITPADAWSQSPPRTGNTSLGDQARTVTAQKAQTPASTSGPVSSPGVAQASPSGTAPWGTRGAPPSGPTYVQGGSSVPVPPASGPQAQTTAPAVQGPPTQAQAQAGSNSWFNPSLTAQSYGGIAAHPTAERDLTNSLSQGVMNILNPSSAPPQNSALWSGQPGAMQNRDYPFSPNYGTDPGPAVPVGAANKGKYSMRPLGNGTPTDYYGFNQRSPTIPVPYSASLERYMTPSQLQLYRKNSMLGNPYGFNQAPTIPLGYDYTR